MFDVLDISKWNEVTDYNAMIKNVEGVILRVGYRAMRTGALYMDPKFEQHYNGLKDKTAIGIYWFTNAINVHEAKEEARYVLEAIKKYKMNLVFPVMIDSEYSNDKHDGRADNLTKKARTDVVVAFCEAIIAAGYEAGIYASDSWFVSMLEYDRIDKYPKWVASYSKAPVKVKKYCGWQYTSRSPEEGVKYYGGVTGLDRSHWYSHPDSISRGSNNTNRNKTVEVNPQPVSVVAVSIEQMDKAGKELVSKVTGKIGIDPPAKPKLVKNTKFTVPSGRRIGLYSKQTAEYAVKYLIEGRSYYIWSEKWFGNRVRICKAPNEYTSNGMVNYSDIVDLLEPAPGLVGRLVAEVDDSLKKVLPGKTSFKNGEQITLTNVDMFSSSTKVDPVRKISGTYYVWSNIVHNYRIRITTSADYTGVHGKVTAWINVSDI